MMSKEGTTQGDPLAMPWYSVSTGPIISSLRIAFPSVSQVWLADDASAAGNLGDLYDWFKKLEDIGKGYGYLVNGQKSWLIVKNEQSAERARILFGETVNVTTEGKRHLGAVLGSLAYKESYCNGMVDSWIDQLKVLSEFAVSQPQAAYAVFTKGFRSKFTFFFRSISGFEDFISPLDSFVTEKFLPIILGLPEACLPEGSRDIFALGLQDGGLGLPFLCAEAEDQHRSSKMITSLHKDAIINQQDALNLENGGQTIDDLKSACRLSKAAKKKEQLREVMSATSNDLKPYLQAASDRGASNWLSTLPLKAQNYNLSKGEFRDAVRLRYGIPLENLPSFCPCGAQFSVQHAFNCKLGGFVHERHDNVRDFLGHLLGKVCKNVEKEPVLQRVTGEQFTLRSANVEDEARLDIKAGSFWQRGQTSFFDIRVTNVLSQSQINQSTKSTFQKHENSKKREYLERVTNIENGSFTPLVFGTNGGMGEECKVFLSRLADKISSKTEESYAQTMTYLRTQLSFELIRSAIMCLRGTRIPFCASHMNDLDCEMANFNGSLK